MATLISAKQLDTSVSSSVVNGDLLVTGSVSASRVIGVDVVDVKGAFKVYPTYADMIDASITLVSHRQIVWVEEDNSLYQAIVSEPDFSSSFTSSVTWNEFSFPNDASIIATSITGHGLFTSGSVINVGEGDGISVSPNSISLNTGSLHFQSGVERVISSGSYTIDGGAL